MKNHFLKKLVLENRSGFFTAAGSSGATLLALLHQLDLDRQLELGQLVWLKLARELL